MTRPVVVLDLETTGTWIEKDRIIEIGMVRLSPAEPRRTYLQRVNPGIPVPQAVTQLTGIADADLVDKPSFADIAGEVLDFIADADFGGFNVARFDLPILEREVFETGLRLEWRHRTIYDAQKIYHIHEKRDLKAAYKFYCNKDLVSAHTALGDTEAALEILASQVERYGGSSGYLESLIDFDYEPITDFFDADRKFRWWNGELYPLFGKYGRKHSVKEIAVRDAAYLEYLITTDFDESVRAMLRDALNGKFPPPPGASPKNAASPLRI